ncbi:MAG: ectoine/hydroxyectoine ABC transporter substrate-binding protein EhuB [Nitriliruptoraceae bacterium]|nr:ectoine/hydroxyectoine ABC transporter substrate-binding protein EhuB [Nitriliruptoraceae bacterium]
MRTTRTRTTWRLAAGAASVALLAAACGIDETDDAADIVPDEDADDDAAAEDEETAEDDAADDGAVTDGLLGELQDAGSATIGIANEVPYAFEDEDGNVTGQAPEIAYVVLEELGITDVSAEIVEFGALIPGLQAGQFDLIAAGMFITPDRAEQVIFADPDYCVSYALAVPDGNPMDLTDFDSVTESGATIAVLSGAVDEDYANDAGIPADQIELFNDVNAQYEALIAGRVDAVGGTSLTVIEQSEANPEIEATDFFLPVDADGEEVLGCGGFAFLDQEFRDAFNDVLSELQADDTVFDITTGFGFAEEDVRLAEDLTVEDLAG